MNSKCQPSARNAYAMEKEVSRNAGGAIVVSAQVLQVQAVCLLTCGMKTSHVYVVFLFFFCCNALCVQLLANRTCAKADT